MSKIINYLKYHSGNLIIRAKTEYYKYKKFNDKKIFIIGVVEHSNFGDFAISEAEYQFLKDRFDCNIIEITEEEISNPLTFDLIDSMIKPDDIIFLHGGGNFGSVYLFHENYRRNVISRYPNNKIILFPQTMYFTDDEAGKKEFEISRQIYNEHKNLTLCLRDMQSFEKAEQAFSENNVIFCTDMVLYFIDRFDKPEPDGSIMVLFRAGLESKYSPEEKEILIEKLGKKYIIKKNSHASKEKVTTKNRYSLIKNQVNLYAQSSVVLTDKLHGAIFSILSGTPCVMVSNFNHKLSSVYKLFENTEGYYFANSLEEVPGLIDKAVKIKKCTNPDFTEYYEKIYINAIQ